MPFRHAGSRRQQIELVHEAIQVIGQRADADTQFRCSGPLGIIDGVVGGDDLVAARQKRTNRGCPGDRQPVNECPHDQPTTLV